MKTPFLSVIMPVYNEKETVLPVIEKVLSLDMVKEIIVVDDASVDGTGELLSRRELGPRVRLVRHKKNAGKGAAIRTGLREVSGEVVAIQDADFEYDPMELVDLVRPIKNGVADVVYGSRLWGGKPQRVYMFWHLVGNRFLTLMVNILFNSTLTDIETCYKVVKADIFKGLGLRSNDFSIEPEITAKLLKKKLRVYEMPISYYGRTYDEGKKIRWVHGIGALWAIFKYRFVD